MRAGPLFSRYGDNGKMHGGNILTTDDVVYSIDRFRKVAIGPSALAPVVCATALPGNQVEVTIEAAFVRLLRTFTDVSIGIYSKTAIEKVGNDVRSTLRPGSYNFVEFIPGNRMVLEVSDDYWAEKP